MPPNFFALRPALGLPDDRVLRETFRNRAMIALAVGIAALVIAAGLALRFPEAENRPEPTLLAASASADGSLILLADNALHLHGRSGRGLGTLEASALGLQHLERPLLLLDANTVIVAGRTEGASVAELWRCQLAPPQCSAATPEPLPAAPHALAATGTPGVLLLQTVAGELLRLEDGAITARAPLPLGPGQARLLYDGGLLRVPAEDGPMLGVFRPDRAEFARQLDALLLMPPDAVNRQQNRIADIARVGSTYWALLQAEDGSTGLYHFDQQWNPLDNPALPADTQAVQLITWRDKLLVALADGRSLLRFAEDGQREAPLQSELLAARWEQYGVSQRTQGQWRHRLALAAFFTITGALTVAALLGLVASKLEVAGQAPTALLDPMPGGIHWLPKATASPGRLRRLGSWLFIALLGFVMLALALAGASGIVAIIPTALGTAIAMRLLAQGFGGHCGLVDSRLIAVDHEGRYSFAARQQVRGSRHFVFLGPVALPLDPALLPNLQGAALRDAGHPGEDPLDTTAVIARLIARGHPWGRALLWLSGGWLLALGLLSALLLAG